MLGRQDRARARGKNEIDLEADEVGCQLGQSLRLPLRIAVLQGDTLALHIPEVAKPLTEGLEVRARVVGSKGRSQNPNPRHVLRLLGNGGKRHRKDAEGQYDDAP